MIKIYRLKEISQQDYARIFYRSQLNIDSIRQDVSAIIEEVRTKGDAGLIGLIQKFDDAKFSVARLKVSDSDFEKAYAVVPPDTVERIKEQVSFSKAFHSAQKQRIQDWQTEITPGVVAGERWTPIDKVGLYVPGGKNPFPTVQQILAVPAVIAGCPYISSCISPTGDNFEVLVAANEAGLRNLYRMSGAQAIAALAYGTETIQSVDLISGPGSPFVTAAKILCQSQIAIDMPAGPSETLILADDSTTSDMDIRRKAVYCAADLLTSAEHGGDSAAVLVTNSELLAALVAEEVAIQQKTLSRKKHIDKSLETYSAILVTETIGQAVEFVNEYAPEHLQLLTEDPLATFGSIRNAGSVYLGPWSPAAAGDYAIGVNLTLPTGLWAKKTSPVGVWTFMKRTQFSNVSPSGLQSLRPIIKCISSIEQLDAHQRSIDVRFI